MPLRVKAVNQKEAVAFVPQFANERTKADADSDYQPLTLHLRRMTEREAESFREFGLRDGEVQANQEDCAQIVFAHAVKIEGLSLELTDGVVMDITDGEVLGRYRDTLPGGIKFLLVEAGMEVVRLSGLTEDEAKN